MAEMTLGSLFDGSGGFPLAGAMNGIKPVWASEIEPYPIAVTRSRFPDMLHLGSVAEIDGGKIPPVDVITFGSPCQDMSVAGGRAGMKHEGKGDGITTRSGLFYEAIRIIKEMREATYGEYPTYAVWENVPGAFSSNKGEDFRCVLEALARIGDEAVSVPGPARGKWANAGEIVGDSFSIAWRVLDAQYWGVPQRRKRIYLVADFRAGRAAKILFEREGVRGHSEKGGEARQETASDSGRSADGSNQAGFLNPLCFMGSQSAKARSIAATENCAPTLKASASGTNQAPSVVYAIEGNTVDRASAKNGKGYCDDISPTLNTQDRHVIAYDARGNGDGLVLPTITGDHENRVTDFTAICVGNGQLNQIFMDDKTETLNSGHDQQAVIHASIIPLRRYVIRRLIPTECCRSQGFPDGWGEIDHKDQMPASELGFWEAVRQTHAKTSGKTYRPFKTMDAALRWYNGLHTDSSEYKMWGNGIALPCAAFVLEGIAAMED